VGDQKAAQVIKVEDLTVIDLRSDAFLADPEAAVSDARDAGEAGLARSQRGIEALSYDAFVAVSRDPRFDAGLRQRLHNVGITEGPAYELLMGNMLGLEGDAHRRHRKASVPFFRPDRVERFRQETRTWIDEWLDELRDSGEFDFHDMISQKLPTKLFASLVGAPLDDARQIVTWASEVLEFALTPEPEVRDSVEHAATDLGDYIRALIEARRQDPRDDYISALIEAESEGVISTEEIVHIAFATQIASVDTTDYQLCMNLDTLARHPDQWATLKRNPSLGKRGVDELVRFESSAMSPTVRVCHEVTEFRGVEIEPGVPVWGCAFSANKDPSVFADPRTLVLARPLSKGQLSFGIGPHACLGRLFAMMEMQEVLLSLIDKWEEFEVDSTWSGSPHVLIPDRCVVRFRPSTL
jgi:cytochrome P450